MKRVLAIALLALSLAGCSPNTDTPEAKAKAAAGPSAAAASNWTLRRDVDAMTDVESISLIGRSTDLASAIVIKCASTLTSPTAAIVNDDLWPDTDDGYFVDTRFDKDEADTFQQWPGARTIAIVPDDRTSDFLRAIEVHKTLLVRAGSSVMVGDSLQATFDLAGFADAHAEHLAACRRIQPKAAPAGG